MSSDPGTSGTASGPNRPLWGPAPSSAPASANRVDKPAGTETQPPWPDSVPPRPPPAPPAPPPHPLVLPPPAQQPPPDVSPSPPRRPGTAVIAAAATVALLVAGGIVWVAAPTNNSSASAALPITVPSTSVPDTSPPSVPTTTSAAVVSGDGLVTLDADAASAPAAQAILSLVDTYFTAINSRDYDAWAATVVPKRSQHQPADQWTRGYESTDDQSIEISSITDSGPDTVIVAVSFVSTQDLAHAPADLQAERICWQSRWPVVDVSSGGRIDLAPSGTTTSSAC